MSTKVQIQGGSFQNATGAPVVNGYLSFTLSQNAVVSGTAQVVPLQVLAVLNISGSVPTSPVTSVWGNDSLTPSGTTYQVALLDANKNQIANLGNWSLTGAGPIDLSTIIPTSVGASYPTPLVVSPSADQSIATNNLLPAPGNTTQSLGSAAALWNIVARILKVGTFNGLIIVDGNQYTTIALAAAAAGSAKNVVIIPPTYGGVESGPLIDNVTYWDFRDNIISTNNTITFNTVSGSGLVSMLRGIHTATAITAGGNVSGYFQNIINNATSTSGTADGGSFELDFTGTLSGTVITANGAENVALVDSTGGTITELNGEVGYIKTGLGSTTAITNAIGVHGLGTVTAAGSVPTNSYAVKGDVQTLASGENFAGYFTGTVVSRTNGGGSGIVPAFTKNTALLVADGNVTLGTGTGKVYGVIGCAKASGDAAGDRAFGGWFKANASNNGTTEIGIHAEVADSTGIIAEFSQGGSVKSWVDGAGALTIGGATPTGTGTNLGLGNTSGFGNGAAGTAVTTSLKGTGSGPTTPQTVVKYLEIDLGGTKYWLPLVQ